MFYSRFFGFSHPPMYIQHSSWQILLHFLNYINSLLKHMHLFPFELQWKWCLLEIIVTVLWFTLYLLISALISCLRISVLKVSVWTCSVSYLNNYLTFFSPTLVHFDFPLIPDFNIALRSCHSRIWTKDTS